MLVETTPPKPISLLKLAFENYQLYVKKKRNDICISIFDNFCDNFLFHIHIIFLVFHSVVLVSVSISTFLYKFIVVTKIVTQIVVQITHL